MPSIIRPVHVAAAAFVVVVLGGTIVALATSASPSEPADRSALVLTATFVRNSLFETSDGANPTPVPEIATSQAVDPLPPAATVEATSEPQRSCDAIREDGNYLDDAERDYFLEACLASEAAQPFVPAVAGASALTLTEAERAYRVRAEGIATSYLTSFQRYTREQLTGSESAAVEYGGLAGGWANQMDNFAPVPARFLPAHQRLQVSLWELAAHTRLVAAGQADLADSQYSDQLLRLVDAADAAIDAYLLVLGIAPPS